MAELPGQGQKFLFSIRHDADGQTRLQAIVQAERHRLHKMWFVQFVLDCQTGGLHFPDQFAFADCMYDHIQREYGPVGRVVSVNIAKMMVWDVTIAHMVVQPDCKYPYMSAYMAAWMRFEASRGNHYDPSILLR